MAESSIKNILDITMEKLRAVVDADTIVGKPIIIGENTLIPVSKITMGVASGGADFPSKTAGVSFGGGGGAGLSVTPVAFLSVTASGVRVLPITTESNSIDRAIAAAPEIIDKVKETFTPAK